jgi:hypothetical protein
MARKPSPRAPFALEDVHNLYMFPTLIRKLLIKLAKLNARPKDCFAW